MRLFRCLPPKSSSLPPTSVAVGNFDGLHRGHQALVHEAMAGEDGLASAVMCFEPLPRSYFCPEQPVPRLMRLRDKLTVCRSMGLDFMFQLRFNGEFSARSPENFAREVLAEGVRARRVVVGRDFRFGARAAGDVDALIGFGNRFGFQVRVVEPVERDGKKVSSTRVREALQAGDVPLAAELLGRPYEISGRVIPGRQLGRTLGFATANLRVAEPPALKGICAVRVTGPGLDAHPGVASLGQRPTVAGRDWLLEVHLFDFDGNLYGRHLKVEFVEHLRFEEKFDGLETMKAQMRVDAQRARKRLETP